MCGLQKLASFPPFWFICLSVVVVVIVVAVVVILGMLSEKRGGGEGQREEAWFVKYQRIELRCSQRTAVVNSKPLIRK